MSGTTDDIFTLIRKLSEDRNGDWVELRRSINELDKQRVLAQRENETLKRQNATLEARDYEVELRQLRKRFDEVVALKDSYLENIDAAMSCVDAVILAVPDAKKDEIQGRGAEFFQNARPYLATRIRDLAVDAASARTDKKNADWHVETARSERNVAVRKQLDLEKAVADLRRRVQWFEQHPTATLAEERAVRISTLSCECDRLRKEMETANALIRAHETRYSTAVKALESLDKTYRDDATKADEENEKLKKRVAYLQSISPGADSDAVTRLINTCGHVLTPSARDDRNQAVNAIAGLAMGYPAKAKECETLTEVNLRYGSWLNAVGKHLGLDQHCCGQWWEAHDALERLRRRVERLTTDSDGLVAKLQKQVEELTDIIHDLRKDKP